VYVYWKVYIVSKVCTYTGKFILFLKCVLYWKVYIVSKVCTYTEKFILFLKCVRILESLYCF